MSISAEYWGEGLWKSMYSIALNYPENKPNLEERRDAINFFNSLRSLLPCADCKKHYSELLKRHPINNHVTINRQSLLRWVNLIHNETNKRLGKSEIKLDEISKEIEKHRIVKPLVVPETKSPVVQPEIKHQAAPEIKSPVVQTEVKPSIQVELKPSVPLEVPKVPQVTEVKPSVSLGVPKVPQGPPEVKSPVQPIVSKQTVTARGASSTKKGGCGCGR